MYKYDVKNGVFKVLNDATKYTVSELSWKLLEDHNLYEFCMVDKKSVTIIEDPKTRFKTVSETPIGENQAVTL